MSEYLHVHSDDDVSDEERKQDQFSHRLAKAAWLRTLQSRDFIAAFHEIGYTWRDNTTVCQRTLPGFRFEPSVTDSGLVSSSEDEDERKTEGDADRASDARMSTQDQGRIKQITLQQCWKQHFLIYIFAYLFICYDLNERKISRLRIYSNSESFAQRTK